MHRADRLPAVPAGSLRAARPGDGSCTTLGRLVIAPGALIRDNHGRVGIVLWENPVPKQEWLDMQNDPRMREVGPCRWWAVAPVCGGGACVPEPLLEYIRPAALDDALAVAREHKMSYFTLIRVFPALAEAMPVPEV